MNLLEKPKLSTIIARLRHARWEMNKPRKDREEEGGKKRKIKKEVGEKGVKGFYLPELQGVP